MLRKGRTRMTSAANATATEIISLFDGLFFITKQARVEKMMTPPVTIGYCTDAGTNASAMTST